MNISGIQNYSGFYDYNSIKINEAAKPQQSVPVAEEVKSQPQELMNINVEVKNDDRNFTAYDFAEQYQSDAIYDLKGADSDIRDLDVTKAISEMQKDQVLQQYQFFIGESQAQGAVNAANNTGASTARAVENFTL